MGKARSHPIANTEINPEHSGRIREPNNNDVLCGRGGRVNAHQGNIQFRLLVSEHKHLYLAKTRKKLDKANIAALVVSKIRQLSPPGRFLKEDETYGLWIEIGDVKAWIKTGQALRQEVYYLRNKSSGKTNTPARMHTSNQLQNKLGHWEAFQQSSHHIFSPLDTNKRQDCGTCETGSSSNKSFDSRMLSRMANIIASPKKLNYPRKSNILQPDNNDKNKSFNMRAERRRKFQRPIWKNGKSTEFSRLEEGISKHYSNVTLSCTENEDVANSKRSRMGQCGSSNETFNSSVTSSCFQSNSISGLSTSLGASGLTIPPIFPPSTMSLIDASFSAIVEDMFCEDEPNGYTSYSLSNKLSINLSSYVDET